MKLATFSTDGPPEIGIVNDQGVVPINKIDPSIPSDILNLIEQLDDIQARGSQAAFQSAQQQLERERAAGLGAAQFGLQKFGIEERGRQAQEQLDQRAFDAGE